MIDLASRRLAAFAVAAAVVVTWFIVAPYLGHLHLWPEILLVSIVVLPGTLTLALIALPLWRKRWLFPAAVVLALVAFGCSALATPTPPDTTSALLVRLPPDDQAAVRALERGEAPPRIGGYTNASAPRGDTSGWRLTGNFAKLWAAIFAGWAFVRLFEELSWVVLVAVVIPLVDVISVYRGPTKAITSHHFEVYTAVAIAFVVPGGGAAYLGPPDVLFYALFLAAAQRFGLRVVRTWISITGMYALTVILATAIDVGGLPALPFLSFGFLAPNADILWRQLRRSRTAST
jgi:hypothetical protein